MFSAVSNRESLFFFAMALLLFLPHVVVSDEAKSLWPVVDCSKLVQNQPDPKADAAIAKALTERGFFFAAHLFGNDVQVMEETYQVSKAAHALPVEVKQEYAGRGYTGLDVNVAELAYEPNKKANVMAWDYAKHHNSFVMETAYPEGLQEAMERLYNRQAVIGKVLLESMARGLGLPHTAFSQYCQEELGSLRLLRYPVVPDDAQDDNDDLTGVSAHTDFEAFTLMHQDSPGLQVRAKGSKVWETVPLSVDSEHAFLIIVGDVLERMTNGYLQATPHRVLPTTKSDTDRYSIIRFNAFAGDALIQPLQQFVNDTHPAAYAPVTMAEHMRVTIENLQAGKGAWDAVKDKSTTADFDYAQTCTQQEGAAVCG